MGILSWIIVGGLAGWIASKVMKGGSMGLLGNIIVGIIGAFVGGFIVNLIGGKGVTGINIWSILVAVLGAIVFIWVVRKINLNM